MREDCSICLYWKRDGHDGICRVNAPVPVIIEQSGNAPYTVMWPRTTPDWYCGQFKARVEAK